MGNKAEQVWEVRVKSARLRQVSILKRAVRAGLLGRGHSGGEGVNPAAS